MPFADFVHLRVHSAYSLSEGALRIKDIVSLCQRYQMPAVGIADTNNLFGALEFSLAAQEAGLQPVIGAKIGLRRQDTGGGGRQTHAGILSPDEVVLLAQSEIGYQNILALVSQVHRTQQLCRGANVFRGPERPPGRLIHLRPGLFQVEAST